jgi:hypothetical protein
VAVFVAYQARSANSRFSFAIYPVSCSSAPVPGNTMWSVTFFYNFDIF